MRENLATFPTILDCSPAARKVVDEDYTKGETSAVPMSYLIGRDGTIIDGWYGFSDRDQTPFRAMKKAGITLDAKDTPAER